MPESCVLLSGCDVERVITRYDTDILSMEMCEIQLPAINRAKLFSDVLLSDTSIIKRSHIIVRHLLSRVLRLAMDNCISVAPAVMKSRDSLAFNIKFWVSVNLMFLLI